MPTGYSGIHGKPVTTALPQLHLTIPATSLLSHQTQTILNSYSANFEYQFLPSSRALLALITIPMGLQNRPNHMVLHSLYTVNQKCCRNGLISSSLLLWQNGSLSVPYRVNHLCPSCSQSAPIRGVYKVRHLRPQKTRWGAPRADHMPPMMWRLVAEHCVFLWKLHTYI